jgi:hypothetical protein
VVPCSASRASASKKIPVKRNTSKVHCSEFNSIFTAQISVTDCSTCVNFLSQNS